MTPGTTAFEQTTQPSRSALAAFATAPRRRTADLSGVAALPPRALRAWMRTYRARTEAR